MKAEIKPHQLEFLNLLGKYINTGSIFRSDPVFATVNSKIPFYRNAAKIIDSYSASRYTSSQESASIDIPSYKGTNSAVLKIKQYLHLNLKNEIFAAILHGSLASDEEISYSDFDALIILKDNVFESKKKLINTAIHLSKCYSFMIEFDPLQHHGWFVMTESDLLNYPENYLPAEVLNHSKSFFDSKTINLKPGLKTRPETSVHRLLNSIEKQLKSDYVPINLYEAKSILSEFMLLPTLFIQKKTGAGIYKKFSFEMAREYFTTDEWNVMDEISEIRATWIKGNLKLPFIVPCVVSVPLKRKLKNISGKLPSSLESKFKSGLGNRMKSFIQIMKIKSDEK